MEKLNDVITAIDDFVWGPVMLILLVGTGIFLTIRTRFLTWRNLGYALKSTLSERATLWGLRRRWFPVARELWSGCGSLLHLV